MDQRTLDGRNVPSGSPSHSDSALGIFQRRSGNQAFCQPLAAKTKDGRDLATWHARYISCLKVSNIHTGPLFRNDKGAAMSVAELDVHFHAVLLEVQRRFDSVIPDSVKVKESYSIYISLRRGTTLEAQNVGHTHAHTLRLVFFLMLVL